MIDPDGQISRLLPISPELQEVVDNLDKSFRKVFGRAPRGDDPMMLAKYLHSPDDIAREAVNAMEKTGIHPAAIYAYKKTGLMPIKGREDLVPSADLDEWNAAADEYEALPASARKPSVGQRTLNRLVDELPSLIIALGYFMEYTKPPNEPDKRYSDLVAVDHYVLFACLRATRTLRSLTTLLEERRSFDALALARTLYEIYLHLRFIEAQPAHLRDLVDAPLGVVAGTHEYGDHKGRKVIRHKITGERFHPSFSRFKMSRCSGLAADENLHDMVYEHLSSFIHPSFFSMLHQGGDDPEADQLSETDPVEPAFCTILFTLMILDAAATIPSATAEVRADIENVVSRVKRRALALMKLFEKVSDDPFPFNVFTERLKELGRRSTPRWPTVTPNSPSIKR
jgi:hypothetical protein